MRAPLYVLAFITAFINDVEPKRREERGAAITEYVVLISIIVLAAAALQAAGIWGSVGTKIKTMIDGVGGTAA
jgi:Flp pilus assembly pilin Flp